MLKLLADISELSIAGEMGLKTLWIVSQKDEARLVREHLFLFGYKVFSTGRINRAISYLSRHEDATVLLYLTESSRAQLCNELVERHMEPILVIAFGDEECNEQN